MYVNSLSLLQVALLAPALSVKQLLLAHLCDGGVAPPE
jgi:hypothetical protein